MTILFLILAATLAAAAWCIVSKAGEAEKICKYGYITEEETNNEN